jgi:hypothetical protein
MSIIEGLAVGVGASIMAGVALSKAKDILGNEDLKSALKYINDRSNKIPKRAEAYVKAIEIVLDDAIPFSKHNKKILIYLNSSLVSAISKIYENLNDSSIEQNKSETIVGVMLQEKLKKSMKSQIILIICFALNLILFALSVVNFSYILFILVSVMILAIHVDQKLIDHRIRKGWYGKSEFEAKEIINFIVSHANKDDFNDSGGLKQVIPLPEAETEKQDSDILGGVTA